MSNSSLNGGIRLFDRVDGAIGFLVAIPTMILCALYIVGHLINPEDPKWGMDHAMVAAGPLIVGYFLLLAATRYWSTVWGVVAAILLMYGAWQLFMGMNANPDPTQRLDLRLYRQQQAEFERLEKLDEDQLVSKYCGGRKREWKAQNINACNPYQWNTGEQERLKAEYPMLLGRIGASLDRDINIIIDDIVFILGTERWLAVGRCKQIHSNDGFPNVVFDHGKLSLRRTRHEYVACCGPGYPVRETGNWRCDPKRS